MSPPRAHRTLLTLPTVCGRMHTRVCLPLWCVACVALQERFGFVSPTQVRRSVCLGIPSPLSHHFVWWLRWCVMSAPYNPHTSTSHTALETTSHLTRSVQCAVHVAMLWICVVSGSCLVVAANRAAGGRWGTGGWQGDPVPVFTNRHGSGGPSAHTRLRSSVRHSGQHHTHRRAHRAPPDSPPRSVCVCVCPFLCLFVCLSVSVPGCVFRCFDIVSAIVCVCVCVRVLVSPPAQPV